jgi:hypothetical protein
MKIETTHFKFLEIRTYIFTGSTTTTAKFQTRRFKEEHVVYPRTNLLTILRWSFPPSRWMNQRRKPVSLFTTSNILTTFKIFTFD